MPLEVFRDGASAVVVDDDHPNVLVITWVGSATVKTVERFYDWAKVRVAKAQAAKRFLVMINDALDAERPGPEVRAAFARHDLEGDVVLASPVVLDSALVRGAMTAIGWMMGDRMKGVSAHATLEDAFEAARVVLGKRGVKIDKDAFVGYRRPLIAKVRASGG